jgi:MoaA/NifB/PqqE/SkfB family radical SAM enzyme
MLHLLGRCNLKCHHCYMEGAPSRREQLPLERVIAAIEESETLGIGTLYLTGGEPTLYRGLPSVLRAASRVSGLQTTLCTNATLITDRLVALFKENDVRLSVSIDGDEPFHDYFRALKGAFRAADKGVRAVARAGLSITVVVTVSQANRHLVPRVAEWSADVGASKLLVQPLLKLGRGIQIADQRLTSVQLNELILQLSDLANMYRAVGLDCALIGKSRRFLMAHPCGAYVCNGTGCHRGVTKEIKKVVVREDGTVLPEVTNLSHEFALGNISDGPLSGLVARYFETGYDKFDRLCRKAYAEVLPTWQDAFVPWDQIVAERSYNWRDDAESDASNLSCGTCSSDNPSSPSCSNAVFGAPPAGQSSASSRLVVKPVGMRHSLRAE